MVLIYIHTLKMRFVGCFADWRTFVCLWLLVSSNEFMFGEKIKLNEKGTGFFVDSSRQPEHWTGGRWFKKDSEASGGTWPHVG